MGYTHAAMKLVYRTYDSKRARSAMAPDTMVHAVAANCGWGKETELADGMKPVQWQAPCMTTGASSRCRNDTTQMLHARRRQDNGIGLLAMQTIAVQHLQSYVRKLATFPV